MSPPRQGEPALTLATLAWQVRPDAFPDVTRPLQPSFPPRLFWLLHTVGWAGYFVLGYVSGLAHGKGMGYWKLPLSTAIAGFVVTLGMRYLLRALWHLPLGRLVGVMIVPILIASGVMALTFQLTLIEWCGEECRPWTKLGYFAYIATYLYVVLAWFGFYVGLKYHRQLRQQTEAALAATAMAHQAQLKMLRYQLNPHFLFNTLNAISTLILDRETGTANRMVQGLSAFLRHSLDNDPMQRVTLRQELDALNLYLNIEKVRFGDRLRLRFQIDPDTWSALMPSLLLQPLIENAIKYAVAKKVDGGTLEVHARRDGDMLEVRVCDDGPGSPHFAPGGPPSKGVGLVNTRERLRVLYGARQSFEVSNRDGGGVEIVIRLPFESGGAPRE